MAARSLVVLGFMSMLAIAPSNACSKIMGKKDQPDPTPVPIPVTSATPTTTTPPIWAPPDTGGPLPTAPVPAVSANPDLTKARAAATAGEYKKVRTLLEKKVKAGKGSPEEAALLLQACTSLKDKACVEMVKAKHPEIVPAEPAPPPAP